MASSPRWLITLTAIRPDSGLVNGREILLRSVAHAPWSTSALKIVFRRLVGVVRAEKVRLTHEEALLVVYRARCFGLALSAKFTALSPCGRLERRPAHAQQRTLRRKTQRPFRPDHQSPLRPAQRLSSRPRTATARDGGADALPGVQGRDPRPAPKKPARKDVKAAAWT